MLGLVKKALAAENIIDNPTNVSTIGEILVLGVRILLVGAGVVAVIVLILGGYTYITSAGNPEQAGKAKATILYGIIGLLIALLAVYIVEYIFVSHLGISRSILHL